MLLRELYHRAQTGRILKHQILYYATIFIITIFLCVWFASYYQKPTLSADDIAIGWKGYPDPPFVWGLAAIIGAVLGFIVFMFDQIGFASFNEPTRTVHHHIMALLLTIPLVIGVISFIKDSFWINFAPFALLLSIALAEAIFLIDKQKPTEENNQYWFTAKVKAESYIDVLIIWTIIATGKTIYDRVNQNLSGILQYAIYPLMFFGVVGFVGIYIWINSLKYHTKTKPIEPPSTTEQTEENP